MIGLHYVFIICDKIKILISSTYFDYLIKTNLGAKNIPNGVNFYIKTKVKGNILEIVPMASI